MKRSLSSLLLIGLSAVTVSAFATDPVQLQINQCVNDNGTSCPTSPFVYPLGSKFPAGSAGSDLNLSDVTGKAYAYPNNRSSGPDCLQTTALSQLKVTVYNNTTKPINLFFNIVAGDGGGSVQSIDFSTGATLDPNTSSGPIYINNITYCPQINFSWQ